MSDTRYLVRPDRIEPIKWTEYTNLSAKDRLERDMFNIRGPFPTLEIAQEWRYIDQLEGYWKSGMRVWARHCLRCGRFAKVLAFDNNSEWAWHVTECKRCGVIDSRDV